jgi:hypothetical protein
VGCAAVATGGGTVAAGALDLWGESSAVSGRE